MLLLLLLLFYSPQIPTKESVLINFKRNYKNNKDMSSKFTCLVIYLTQTPNSTNKIYNIARPPYNLVSNFQIYIYSAPHITNMESTSSSADAEIGTISAIFKTSGAPCGAGS